MSWLVAVAEKGFGRGVVALLARVRLWWFEGTRRGRDALRVLAH